MEAQIVWFVVFDGRWKTTWKRTKFFFNWSWIKYPVNYLAVILLWHECLAEREQEKWIGCYADSNFKLICLFNKRLCFIQVSRSHRTYIHLTVPCIWSKLPALIVWKDRTPIVWVILFLFMLHHSFDARAFAKIEENLLREYSVSYRLSWSSCVVGTLQSKEYR